MKLIFERSHGCRNSYLPECNLPVSDIGDSFLRSAPPALPECAEVDVDRHYAELAKQVYGVCSGFYPLGSCTMKYNPAVNEAAAALPGFTGIHPLQPEDTASGCAEVIGMLGEALCAVTGMQDFTLQPAAGAHGEFTGLLMIKAWHDSRADTARTKIIVPDSAHGTNPASAAMAGFTVINIPSDSEGFVDLNALRAAVGSDTAGLMLTNPNTLGLFDKNILEITHIIHSAGGLCYYDGANLNAVMGIARPGDMGFDVMHLNLHKTFSTPHGGGGPGSGPVGCKDFLRDFLPSPVAVRCDSGFALVTPKHTIGRVRGFAGSFGVLVKALAYILSLGGNGLKNASEIAVLNANYLMKKLADAGYEPVCGGRCMHEFVLSLEALKKETGVSAMDVAKSLSDLGIHPPTMYFPLIVHEALMFEPTETESKETLDTAAQLMSELLSAARSDAEKMHGAPHSTPISHPDEVTAARNPILRYIP